MSTKRLMTLEEVSTDLTNSGHKRAALFDSNGEQIIGFNNTKTPIADRWKDIQKRLKSKVTSPGIYQVKAKHLGPKSKLAIYYISVGDQDQNLADLELKNIDKVEIVEAETVVTAPPLFTPQEYMELQRDVMTKELDVERLEMKIKRLEEDLAAAQENEQEEGLLSEGTKSFLSDSLETLVPIVDRVLDQRDKNIRLEALRIAQGNPNGKQAPAAQNGQAIDAGAEDDFLSENEEQELALMARLKEENPELYAQIMDMDQEEEEEEAEEAQE